MILLISFLILIMFISLMIMILNWYLSTNIKSIQQKNSPFECGFEPFESSRLPFSIQFYLISIMFLVFDIEIVLLFPIINSLKILNILNWTYSSMMILIILFLGLEFEKKEGIMKWFM